MIYNNLVDNKKTKFQEWFWDKYEIWRKGTNNGPTAFSRFLDVPQQHVSAWLNGEYTPRSAKHIGAVARKYPEIYDILELPVPVQQDIPWNKLPLKMRIRLVDAFTEWTDALTSRNLDPESAEALKLAEDIFGKYGLVVTLTDDEKSG